MPNPRTCPVCHSDALTVDLSGRSIEWDSKSREAFVMDRLGHRPEFAESMDLTRFMHGGPARLLTCPACGLLLRDERAAAHYEDDLYDSVLMRHLYPRYLGAFRDKKRQYQPMLRPGAEVLEVGSHLGAFLQTAEEWGWRPVGLDIGDSTSAFARRQGLTVKRFAIEDYSPRLTKPEAIFVWNCFEQIEDPSAALRQSHQLLRPHGLLVVRVPNADFYREQRRQLGKRSSGRALKLLAYNNLLGFPYLHGYTPASLDRLLRTNHFEPVRAHNSSLLTPPYPEMAPRIREEWREARSEGERSLAVNGPWIEFVCRRSNG